MGMKKVDFLNHVHHFSLFKERLDLRHAYWRPDIIESWAAVHLIFARDELEGLKLAMIRRTKKEEDPWSGHYAFPGGRVEEGEGLIEASRRETFEEVGIELIDDVYLGEFFHLQLFYKGKALPYAISAHASYLPQTHTFNPCPDEVDEAFWFPLRDLHNEKNIKSKSFRMSQGLKELPCIEFEGHTIWGISYLILREICHQYHDLPFSLEDRFSKELMPAYPYGNALDEK